MRIRCSTVFLSVLIIVQCGILTYILNGRVGSTVKEVAKVEHEVKRAAPPVDPSPIPVTAVPPPPPVPTRPSRLGAREQHGLAAAERLVGSWRGSAEVVPRGAARPRVADEEAVVYNEPVVPTETEEEQHSAPLTVAAAVTVEKATTAPPTPPPPPAPRVAEVMEEIRNATYLGCFEDRKGALQRDLEYLAIPVVASALDCFSGCISKRYKYSGLQNGVECWCSNRPRRKWGPAPEGPSICDAHCPDETTPCGGPLRNAIYNLTSLFQRPSPLLDSLYAVRSAVKVASSSTRRGAARSPNHSARGSAGPARTVIATTMAEVRYTPPKTVPPRTLPALDPTSFVHTRRLAYRDLPWPGAISRSGEPTKEDHAEHVSLARSTFDDLLRLQAGQGCDRTLTCQPRLSCGAGCGLHQLVYCFIVGWSDNRTVLVNSATWKYQRDCANDDWTCLFARETPCGAVPRGPVLSASMIGKEPSPKHVILGEFLRTRGLPANFVPHASTDGPRVGVPFFQPNISTSYRHLLHRAHPYYAPFIVGSVLRYLTTPNDPVEAEIDVILDSAKFEDTTRRIVGLHVRRTDHRKEGPFIPLERYMYYVREWCAVVGRVDRPTEACRVFVATDDSAMIAEFRAKWGLHGSRLIERDGAGYEFTYGEFKGVASGALKEKRMRRESRDAAVRLLADVTMLARAHFLVGQFSSQVFRMAFELKSAQYNARFARAEILEQDYGDSANSTGAAVAALDYHVVAFDDPWYSP